MHERVSVSSICFVGAPLSEVIAHWQVLQPRRVSLLNSEVQEGAALLQPALAASGIQVETVTHTFLPFLPLDSEPSVLMDARERLSRTIDAAAALGARSIYMLTGGHGALTWEQAAEVFAEAIAPCVAHAKAAGIALAIENASVLYADNHIAHTLHDTLTLAELAGIGVCIDLYGVWTEAALQAQIQRAVPRCVVVQWSDYVYGDRSLPCRAVPGDGAIPLRRVMQWLLEAGYKGAFDLELIGPRIDKEGRLDAVRRAADHTSEMLRSLGA
jgi:sugar phosphate isomerase/epimerase